MTVIEWDRVGERRYETGIDRGVLYPRDAPAVPWNGLVSVVETLGAEVKTYYVDGVPYLAHHVPGAYQAKLQAFTYPDELDDLTGVGSLAPGMFAHDQRAKLFHLSYRTKIGNDLDGVDHAYKIHVIYNVIATPSDRTYNTTSDSNTLEAFEWTLYGIPPGAFGMRPTAHFSFDSRLMNPYAREVLETTLYGSDVVDPSLPDLEGLTTIANLIAQAS